MKTLLFRNPSFLLAAILSASAVALVDSFVPTYSIRRSVIAEPLQAYDPYSRNDEGGDPLARNKARTDIRNLLTQRSIQSFVYLLNEVRDIHTTAWIEQILEFKKLDSFHGTGALNMTHFPSWDSFFLQMVTMKTETVVVESRENQKRRQGWSNKGGYLDNLNPIKPVSKPTHKKPELQRPVRGFNSAGYLSNLGPTEIKATNSKAKADSESTSKPQPKNGGFSKGPGSYLENLSNGNADLPGDENKKEKPAKINPYLENEKKLSEYEFEIDPASLMNRIMSVREQISKEWTDDLETLFITNDEILTSYLDKQMDARREEEEAQDKEEDTVPERAILDRSSMAMLTNSLSTQDRDSSPFRRSNFDLLVLLSTQESIHRVLRQYIDDQEEEDFDWLKDFYSKRVATFFDGHGQAYGRADDFLEELIVSPPVAQRTNNDEVHLIDPMKMVEDIIRERSEVAREWKGVVAAIPSDHVDLRRLLLTRRMMEVDDEVGSVPTFSAIPKSKKRSKEGIFEAGAFE